MSRDSFAVEPLRGKLVTSIPGVMPAYAQRLADQGFGKATTLLGKFLVLHQREQPFVEWLQATCGASTADAKKISLNYRMWCHNFFGPLDETPTDWSQAYRYSEMKKWHNNLFSSCVC